MTTPRPNAPHTSDTTVTPWREQPVHPWVAHVRARAGVPCGLTLAVRGPGQPLLHPTSSANPTAAVLAAAELAEQLGFDGVFLPEHPASRNDPLLLGAAIAARTRQVRIGTLALSPLYRHPGLLVRGLADLDAVSDGRAVLGIGLGGQAPDLQRLGLPSPSNAVREARVRVTVDLVQRLWRGDGGGERVSLADDVADVQIDAWRLWPPGVQARPPVIIAGAGERRTLRLAAELGDACNLQPDDFLHEQLTPETIRHKLAVLQRHCDAIGRDPDSLLVTAWNGYTLCAPTEAEAQAKLAALCPNGPRPSSAIYQVGTPEQLAAFYGGWVRAGVHYPVLQPIAPDDHETLELLAREVLPALQA